MGSSITILLLGDIIGQSGCRAVFVETKNLIKEFSADMVIANGENAAEGFGITPEIVGRLHAAGVDVITSGNHIWQKDEILPLLDSEDTLLRPENYPHGETPGKGRCTLEVRNSSVTVVNLQGRDRLSNVDCPFRVAKAITKSLSKEKKIIIIDFHAEEPQEKEALAWYLDGSVSAVVGTHTHVQTADERILSKGTGYISDLGMTGPSLGIIGFEVETAIQRSLTQMPLKNEVAFSKAVIQGVMLKVDTETGNTVSIERINKILSV